MRAVTFASFTAAALLAGSAFAQQPDAPGNQQGQAANQQGQAAGQQSATANLMGPDGADLGTVEFTNTPNGVLLNADLTGLPPGEHGFHIHENGTCEPDFGAAGGHYNPGGAEHGFQVEGGPHGGDMPNIHVPESGELTIEVFNDRVSMEEGAEATLFDDNGSAVIIHANPDDYESQPSGDAGDRIACGVIE